MMKIVCIPNYDIIWGLNPEIQTMRYFYLNPHTKEILLTMKLDIGIYILSFLSSIDPKITERYLQHN